MTETPEYDVSLLWFHELVLKRALLVLSELESDSWDLSEWTKLEMVHDWRRKTKTLLDARAWGEHLLKDCFP